MGRPAGPRAPGRLGGGPRSSAGFTLIELLIAILIIAALVLIAVPVYFALTRKADEAVASANERIAVQAMDMVWLSLIEKGAESYRDPDPPIGLTGPKDVDAKYMSYITSVNRWVDVTVQGDRWRLEGTWKNRTLLPGTDGPSNYYNWDLLVGNIGVLQNWYYWDEGKWNPNAHRDFVFVLTLGKDWKARYTQFHQGKIDLSGEFDWNDGWGHP